jgi:hypothetical protein
MRVSKTIAKRFVDMAIRASEPDAHEMSRLTAQSATSHVDISKPAEIQNAMRERGLDSAMAVSHAMLSLAEASQDWMSAREPLSAAAMDWDKSNLALAAEKNFGSATGMGRRWYRARRISGVAPSASKNGIEIFERGAEARSHRDLKIVMSVVERGGRGSVQHSSINARAVQVSMRLQKRQGVA